MMSSLRGGNVLVSPMAVARDLAVLVGGTDPLTADGRRMMEALGTEDLAGVRGFAAALVRRIDPSWGDTEVDASDLLVVNTRRCSGISDGYRGWLENFDHASIVAFDLSDHLDDAVEAVSAWASESTGGHMAGYQSGLDGSVDLALYDSLHIKGRWSKMFDPGRTRIKKFTLADSGRTQVRMMHSKDRFRYHKDAGYRSVAMGLQGSVSLCVVIPVDGRPDIGGRWAAEDPGFRIGFIDALLDSPYVDVRLGFPRTEVSAETDLMDILSALGMPGGIMLPDITDSPLTLAGGTSSVRLSIDEEGLEASSIIMNRFIGCAPPQEPVRFVVDIPFVFFVRDERSGMDLLVGYVGNPNGSGADQAS